jgi:hypothetical protein
MKKFIHLIIIVLVGVINNANAETKEFVNFRFGSDVSINIPRNWYFPDKKISRQINEDVVHLSGISPVNGNIQILIAANIQTHSNSSAPAAFIQLAVRKGRFMPQNKVQFSDTEEWRRVAQTQINNYLGPSLEETKHLEGIYLAGVNIEKLGNYYSVVVHKIFEYIHWTEMDRTDFIYLGNIVYILNTSYRTDEGQNLKPILKKIRESLSIPAQ